MADGTALPALRAFAENYPEPLVTVDEAGVVRYANPRAVDLLAPPAGDGEHLEGCHADELLAVPDAGRGDDAGEHLLALLERAASGADATAADGERDGPFPGDGIVQVTGRTTEGGAVSLRARVDSAPDGSFVLALATAAVDGPTGTGEAAERASRAPDPACAEGTGGASDEAAGASDGPAGVASATDRAALLRAFETAADGIAILDAEERYRYVNPAHADLYGVEDAASMIGEHWTSLYDDAERERLREEALSALRTEGQWRGDAVGHRVDGERFHQELTLSALPDGGVVCVVRDRSAHHRHERSLEALRGATRELLAAEDPEAVAEVAVRAAAEALDLPLSAVFLHEESRDALEPAATTDAARETFDEIPTFTGDDSLAWRAFETGETQRYEDPATADGLYNEATTASAELIVPLGEYGVMVTGYVEEPGAGFDAEQVRLLHTLAATVTTALEGVESAERLRERNEQLERFSNALSHDLRNPLNTARATLALARTSAGEETAAYLDDLEETHRRMETLIEDVLALARAPADPDTATVELGELVEESWTTACGDTAGATLELDQLGSVEADPGQLRRLFENLFGNAVEHGSTSGRTGTDDAVEHGSTSNRAELDDAVEHGGPDVTVKVGRLPPTDESPGGFYVADDGPGIPPEEREQVFEQGYTTADGTGLGLDIVRRTASAHGWTVSVTESERGGARFEVRGPAPSGG